MRVDQQMVFSVHRIMVRCDGVTENPTTAELIPCMRQMAVYVTGGIAGSLDEALAQVGWYGEGDTHYCLEHQ